MTTSKHTQLPWRVWRPQLPTDPLDIVDHNGGDKVCTMAEFDGPVNAAFIVTACNHHYKLIEALEGIANYASLLKGTDAERIAYLARQPLSSFAPVTEGGV